MASNSASNYTAETQPYTRKPAHGLKTGSRASYTPSAAINEHSYGKDGGKANAVGSIPEVVVGGSSTSQAPPAMPGTLRIGEDKNVSTPVSG